MTSMMTSGLTSSSSRDAFSDFPQSEEPVYLMGKRYSSLHQMSELKNDFMSMIWLTYRSGFPSIGGSGPTSDRGWGCMLRCGQMVLANCLIRRHLGRDWSWDPPPVPVDPYASPSVSHAAEVKPDDSDENPVLASASINNQSLSSSCSSCSSPRNLSPVYKKILSMFEDRKTSPYSIHQISQMGESEGKPVGTWFGPNTVAQAIKKLSAYDHWNKFHVHVAMDNLVIVNEIKSNSSSSEWRPLILFIPLRLGLTEINPIYFRALKSSFQLPSSLGIIGGRPSHALYFVGYVGNEFIYLDPHTTQQVTELSDGNSINKNSSGNSSCIAQKVTEHSGGGQANSNNSSSSTPPNDDSFDDSSYHCTYASRMDMAQLDPSISLCFYCETEADFDTWCHSAKNVFVRGEKQPLFELTKDRPSAWCFPVKSGDESGEPDGFANYDLPETFTQQQQRLQATGIPNVPIEIGRVAESLNQRIDSEDMDDGFEFLG